MRIFNRFRIGFSNLFWWKPFKYHSLQRNEVWRVYDWLGFIFKFKLSVSREVWEEKRNKDFEKMCKEKFFEKFPSFRRKS